ncbi:helix-turn-helix domain-containing protein [Aphanothece sacrum]|uniref:DNA-binding protein n=1 Tax=Aphanothece sacrum FPU1 TaxID=1920663 RepID=A0A401ILL7_APHSA|nr:helix-turn-helix transcriptional regulator [Aphanothece sacrum]GBF82126.1 DNA-binding protein [Aphanothece sacrum FPU1]
MKEQINKEPNLKVKAYREAMGYSQQELAQLLNCHWRTVADWELKGTIPNFEKVVLLAKVFKISLKTLANDFGLDTVGIPDDSNSQPSNELTASKC